MPKTNVNLNMTNIIKKNTAEKLELLSQTRSLNLEIKKICKRLMKTSLRNLPVYEKNFNKYNLVLCRENILKQEAAKLRNIIREAQRKLD